MLSFAENLENGKAGESVIAKWLIRRGYAVLPVYEKILDDGKGPQLYTGGGGLVAPDLLAMKNRNILWFEAKHKTAFSWHRITNRWVTGIDFRHYREYIKIKNITSYPIWVLFLHKGGQAKDSPPNSPAGLFGNELNVLMRNENHRHDNWGRTGMVYWAREIDGGALKKLADYYEVLSINNGFQHLTTHGSQ